MSANSIPIAPSGRKKLARGKERSDAAPGHASQNTSSPEGAKEGGKLPNGWEWKTIRDLVTDEGVFIDGDWVESKDQDPNGDVRLIQLADVGDGVYRDRSDRYMTKAKAEELRCTFLEKGDVLIARMPDPLGRACIFPGDAKPSVTVVDVAIVRSGNGEFDHRWLACFVNANPTRAAISALQAGSTRKRISRGNLATIPLPVPPLPEQRRIVAEIEMQFTRLDAGVSALRRVQANLKRYRAAVLKAACEGKLVPTEAELQKSSGKDQKGFESGEQLLKRILAERRQHWTGRAQYKEPAVPDTATLPPLPAGWTWASIDQLCSHITSGSRDWSQFYGKGNGTFILAQNVRPMRLDLSERQSVAAPQGDAETERTRVRAADLLVTIVGAKTGDICRVPNDLEDHFVCQSVALLRPVVSASAKFAELYLASQENGQAQWKRYMYGQGRPHLSFEQLRMTAIALPPLAEQTRIVAEVERRLSVVEELETVVSSDLRRAARLRQAILRAAFTGQLAASAALNTL